MSAWGSLRAISSPGRVAVRGGRRSWGALATKRRWASNAPWRRPRGPAIVSPSFLSSSSGPATARRLCRFLSEISCVAAVIARSGRSTRPATSRPSTTDSTAMTARAIADPASSWWRSELRCSEPIEEPKPGSGGPRAPPPGVGWTLTAEVLCRTKPYVIARSTTAEGHPHRIAERVGRVVPRAFEDLLARHDSAVGAEQELEDRDLLGTEGEPHTCSPDHPPGRVQLEVAVCKRRRQCRTRPARERTDPRYQLGDRERLGEVIVGTEAEALDAILNGSGCRQHQHAAAGAAGHERAAHLVAVKRR